MRARDFITENTEQTAGEYSTGIVKRIIENVWSSAYPKARLYTGDSYGYNPVFASTKRQYVKNQEYYDGLADPKGHFYLQVSVGYDLPELVINVLDAHAGKFSGIVTKMLDEIYKRLEDQFRDQPTVRTLTVQDDASGGAWQHIAQKLGANNDLHRSHLIQKKSVTGDGDKSLKEFVGPAGDDDGSESTPSGDFFKFRKIITTELAKLGFKTKPLPNLKGGFGCTRKRDENTLDAIMFVPITNSDVLVKQGSIEDGRPYFDTGPDFMYRVGATVDDAIFCLTKIEQDYNLLSLNESTYQEHEDQLRDFIQWCVRKLNIEQELPRIRFQDAKEGPDQHRTGYYDDNDDIMWVYTGNRNLIDIMRTVAHELVHRKQHEDNRVHGDQAYPGSPIEQEADAVAGYLMKLYGKDNPEIIE